ncbi:DNA cytosine methyltransferase [Brevibacillus sp. NRS-1366]|uniref:DNA cytosine methyltransferase n=1 Tax=Brevibacillus sp. NRS-1366 TaxID=3233899 RepID=UPI003D1F65CA
MKMLSLFSGIGGIDLAAQWAGIETVAFCEIEPFCQKVLQKHWPEVPIFEDVRTMNKQQLIEQGVIRDGRAIDIICGGYPCQPFSLAGERKGEADDRHLWPEVSRLLQEVKPSWFVGENVAGHVTLGLDQVLSDLEGIGYTAEPFIIPACAVGADHRRDRVFIVANSNSQRLQGGQIARSGDKVRERTDEQFQGLLPASVWAPISASDLSREAYGVPNRMDRIKSLGNAVVPAQVYPILAAIKMVHDQAT